MALNHDAVHMALRLRAKPALPTAKAYENVTFTPPSGAPYAEEDFAPGTSRLVSATASGGMVEDTGLYVIRWYGLSGEATATMSQAITALLALFPPGSFLTATDGTIVRIQGTFAPRRSQITNPIAGRALSTITIPWLVNWFNPALP
jgi:hypothetical protein